MPRPNPLTPEVQAAFLAELRGGTLVVAAAAKVGVAVQTLYRRRKRDPGFDSEWNSAAEASFGWGWRRLPGGCWRRQWAGPPTARRLRFGAGRRSAYLDALGRKGDCGQAARSARVDPRTVRSALRDDPGFAVAHASALERGLARRARAAAAERARAAERFRRIVERASARPPGPAIRFDPRLRASGGWRPGQWVSRRRAWAPGPAITQLKRRLGRIEMALWIRSRGRGAPLEPGTRSLPSC
jgi:hypothetical protein